MCGITGWIDWERDLTGQEAVVRTMCQTLKRRGPDANGIWTSPHALLGHSRLIVIDPEGGMQPMVYHKDGGYTVLVYNGELYNTSELRRELTGCGHEFLSYSDTEVLLHSYVEWGSSCVERFNGIFAFAVWDEREQKLFMARDRLGVKPLFFTRIKNGLLFGSEIKALLAHPEVEAAVDAEGLAEIFALGPARTPGHGVFRHIQELKPGWTLTYDRRGMSVAPYWKPESRPHEDDLNTTLAKVRSLVTDSIERQLISDVSLCSLLSGGLDSSIITAVAARAFRREGRGDLHTYSVDYVDNDRYFRANEFQPHDDAPWVKRVASVLNTVHRTVKVDTPQLVEALGTAVRARDLPGMADVDASLFLFAKDIKKEATVALSGECADEVFGGYPWFRRKALFNADTFPWSVKLADRLCFLSGELVEKIRPHEYVRDRYAEALAEVPRLEGESREEARMREMFYLNLTRWMPTLLDRKDRMAMAAGLEGRVPFCDHRLVEYMWNVPSEMKFLDNREKGLLRQAMNGLLPEDVLRRKKSPYPKTHNPAYLQAVRERMRQILDDPLSPLLPLIDVKAVRAFSDNDHLSDVHMPWFGQLMNVPQLFAYLIQIDVWLREYKVEIRV